MNPPLSDARTAFIDGPVTIFIRDAAPEEVLAAYTRLGGYVRVLVEELAAEQATLAGKDVPNDPSRT